MQADSALPLGTRSRSIAGVLDAGATHALVGSGLATGTFATTLSFLVSTPGVLDSSLSGFPALSVLPGQFLIKDVVLLAASLHCFAEAWNARRG